MTPHPLLASRRQACFFLGSSGSCLSSHSISADSTICVVVGRMWCRFLYAFTRSMTAARMRMFTCNVSGRFSFDMPEKGNGTEIALIATLTQYLHVLYNRSSCYAGCKDALPTVERRRDGFDRKEQA